MDIAMNVGSCAAFIFAFVIVVLVDKPAYATWQSVTASGTFLWDHLSDNFDVASCFDTCITHVSGMDICMIFYITPNGVGESLASRPNQDTSQSAENGSSGFASSLVVCRTPVVFNCRNVSGCNYCNHLH